MKRFEQFIMPPYAPMLNPYEYFNRDLQTAKRRGPMAHLTTVMRAKAKAFMTLVAAMTVECW